MRKKFTRLVYAGIACFCMVSALAQNGIEVRTVEVAPLKQDVELRAVAQVDSAITYAATGEKTAKTVYTYGAQGRVTYEQRFIWENNRWVNSERESFTYDANGNATTTLYVWESNDWQRGDGKTVFNSQPGIYDISTYGFYCNYIPGIYTGFEYLFYGTGWTTRIEQTKDAKGNITGFKMYRDETGNPNSSYLAIDQQIVYNDRNLPVLINTYNRGTFSAFAIFEYDSNGNIVLFERSWDGVSIDIRYTANYDSNNNLIAGGTNESKTVCQSDSNGNLAIEKFYTWIPNRWYETHYTVYYPNSLTPQVDVGNNNPVDNNNQGGFDIGTPVPADSIYSGSWVIQFPEGITLDENNTGLTVELGDFDLIITKQENNSWHFEIKPKTLRSAALRAGEATNMLHVAYTVDKGLEKGTYDISVNSILFETKGGNLIPEPAITVPAVLTRESVAGEQIESAGATLWITDLTLYIQSAKADRILIYSITGSQLYETAIQPGINTVDAANLPQGILLVKANSGWVTKVVNRK